MPSKRILTAEEQQGICAAYQAGVALAKIEKEFKCGHTAIQDCLSANGITQRISKSKTPQCIDLSVSESFWSRVDRQGNNECWNWIPDHFSFYHLLPQRKQIGPHRFAYMAEHNITSSPPGVLIQKCGNKRCCNPAHIAPLGTALRSEQDLTGKTFGRLRVIELVKLDETPRCNHQWKVVCECGNIKTVGSCGLLKGTQSCGCLMKENPGACKKIYDGNPAMQAVINDYLQGAKRRDIEVSLTREQFENLFQQPCFYCNTLPSNVRTLNSSTYTYSGVDRLDSSKGYHIDNVVSCCKTCNKAKSDMSLDAFIEWIMQLTNNAVRLGKLLGQNEAA